MNKIKKPGRFTRTIKDTKRIADRGVKIQDQVYVWALPAESEDDYDLVFISPSNESLQGIGIQRMDGRLSMLCRSHTNISKPAGQKILELAQQAFTNFNSVMRMGFGPSAQVNVRMGDAMLKGTLKKEFASKKAKADAFETALKVEDRATIYDFQEEAEAQFPPCRIRIIETVDRKGNPCKDWEFQEYPEHWGDKEFRQFMQWVAAWTTENDMYGWDEEKDSIRLSDSLKGFTSTTGDQKIMVSDNVDNAGRYTVIEDHSDEEGDPSYSVRTISVDDVLRLYDEVSESSDMRDEIELYSGETYDEWFNSNTDSERIRDIATAISSPNILSKITARERLGEDGLKEYVTETIVDSKRRKVLDSTNLFSSFEENAKLSDSEDDEITLDTFRQIALNSNGVKEFVEKVRNIHDVPYEVSEEFFNVYGEGGDLGMYQASDKFIREVKGN